jgi:hypothetical protein
VIYLCPNYCRSFSNTLQIYRLEQLQGTTEQNLFQINESIGRDKRQTSKEHAMAVGKTHCSTIQRGCSGCQMQHGKGRGHFTPNRPSAAAASPPIYKKFTSCTRMLCIFPPNLCLYVVTQHSPLHIYLGVHNTNHRVSDL